MKYLSSMEFHQRMPAIPSRIGAAASWLARSQVPANRSVVIDMLVYAQPVPFTPETDLWMDRLGQIAVQPILVTGEREPGQTLARAVVEINQLLDEIYRRGLRGRLAKGREDKN